MTKLEDIEQAIAQLPPSQSFELVRRLRERPAAEWDRQIEEDSKSGALDFLLREVDEDIAKGTARPIDDLFDDR